jgi:hypothetical protein
VRCLPVALFAVAVLLSATSAGAGTGAKAVRIDASASRWAVLASRVVIRGRVSPHPAGLELTLQRRQGSGWLSIGDEAVRADGAFVFVAAPSRPGLPRTAS